MNTVRLTKPPLSGSRLSAQPRLCSTGDIQVVVKSAPKLTTVWASAKCQLGSSSLPKTALVAARRAS